MAEATRIRSFEEYLTVGEAASFLGVSPWTLRNWDNSGKLKSERHPVTGYRIYHPEDLEAWMRSKAPHGTGTRLLAPSLDWNAIGETEHFVQFYEDDRFLIDSVTQFIARAIFAGEGALIIATSNHRSRIRRRLRRRGIDVSGATESGQLIALDADETLSTFMVSGSPDPSRFEESVGSELKRLAQRWPRVRAFGEMVAVLWATDNRQAAVELEALWNDLAQRHSFALFCAYPLGGFDDQAGPSLVDVCDCHTRVIPAESFSRLSDPDKQLRTIADLQHKAHRLEAEIDQRKAADRDRALLAAIIESSDDAIVSKTFDGIIRTWNKGAERIFGYTECEAVGQSIKLIIPPDRFSEEGEILDRLRRGERIDHYETVRVAKDGRRLDISLTISPLRDDQGHLIGASKIARDITEQKRLHEALRESERRYRQLAELLPVGVYACSAAGEITYFNKQATESWGRTPKIGDRDERFCGSLKLFLPDGTYLPHDQCPMAVALREGREFRNQEVVIERPDGAWITALVNIDPIRDPNGTVIGAINVFHDMSALKRAEQDLREQKENLQTLLETLPIAVFISEEPDCRSISGNRAAADLLRMPMGANFSKMAPDNEQPTHFQIWKDGQVVAPESLPMQRASRGEFVRGEEFDYQFEDETIVHMLVHAQPLSDAIGQPRGSVACMLDITDRKNAETALKDADRRKDEFLATLAHELRNPLAPIRNGLSILRMPGRGGDQADGIVEMMERQLAHLVRLVDDLLEVSRISRGKIELKRQHVALSTVINQALEASKPFIESSGHSLNVSLPDQAVMLDGDPVRLSQVFSNLLNNAAKYTNRGGTISVAAKCDGSEIVVSVRDTGIGIPREQLTRVFDLFAQIENPLRHSQEGLGIGLNLVKSLVALHDGCVEAHSDGLGHGAEFVIRLPAISGQLPQTESEASASPLLDTKTPRILIVDDNRDSANSLRMILRILGGDVEVVYDGPSALEAIKICRPSIVLLDIGLPGLDGYEVARQIRDDPQHEDIVLIALTGWGNENDRRRSREAGFDHHLVKPVDLGELKAHLGMCGR